MKIKKFLYRIIILICFIIIGTSKNISFAKENLLNQAMISTSVAVGSSVDLPDLDKYKPQPDSGEKATKIISTLLGVLTVIGIIAIVLSIAVIGFGSILGSASEKAEGKEKYMGIVIAAILITTGSIIARIIISVAESV